MTTVIELLTGTWTYRSAMDWLQETSTTLYNFRDGARQIVSRLDGWAASNQPLFIAASPYSVLGERLVSVDTEKTKQLLTRVFDYPQLLRNRLLLQVRLHADGLSLLTGHSGRLFDRTCRMVLASVDDRSLVVTENVLRGLTLCVGKSPDEMVEGIVAKNFVEPHRASLYYQMEKAVQAEMAVEHTWAHLAQARSVQIRYRLLVGAILLVGAGIAAAVLLTDRE